MDSHFSNVLGQASASQVPQITFIPASSFEGRKHGYKFQKGSKGLGYYYDRFQSKTAVASMAPEPEVSMFVSVLLSFFCHELLVFA